MMANNLLLHSCMQYHLKDHITFAAEEKWTEEEEERVTKVVEELRVCTTRPNVIDEQGNS